MALHFDDSDPGWLRQGLTAGFVLLMALYEALAVPSGRPPPYLIGSTEIASASS